MILGSDSGPRDLRHDSAPHGAPRLFSELTALGSTFAARASEVFAERGLGFLAALRDAFPLEESGEIPAPEALTRLERIHPGFIAWAAGLEDLAVRSER